MIGWWCFFWGGNRNLSQSSLKQLVREMFVDTIVLPEQDPSISENSVAPH